jgi:hypothetical protein
MGSDGAASACWCSCCDRLPLRWHGLEPLPGWWCSTGMTRFSRIRTRVAIGGPVVMAVLAGGCGGSVASAPQGPTASAGGVCRSVVDAGVLPEWARTGFQDPLPRVPHVIGRNGEIAAILFGGTLHASGPHDGNKVLWVSRRPQTSGSDLRISARRMSGSRQLGQTVQRRFAGGAGPSSFDLPESGCWRLTLAWSGRSDVLDLNFASPS